MGMIALCWMADGLANPAGGKRNQRSARCRFVSIHRHVGDGWPTGGSQGEDSDLGRTIGVDTAQEVLFELHGVERGEDPHVFGRSEVLLRCGRSPAGVWEGGGEGGAKTGKKGTNV